ncbi:MAG: CDP-alcohol phosphatidyltransferase family protein [Pirellulaceae bacterium]
MGEYQPTSRRPIADVFRATARFPVAICVRLGIHPDVVSLASLVAAAGAGVCFWQASATHVLLLVGAALCLLRLYFNMLDGMVALASQKASLRGEIVNELPDRLSDVIIFVGVAHSGMCHWASGYWAAILALLTAYVGMLGQAVGAKREFKGVMSKPWRMAVLVVAACVTWGILQTPEGSYVWGPLTVLDWACVVVVVGCMQTILVRLASTLRVLKEASENDGV